MKMLLVAVIMLASAASLWAQDQITDPTTLDLSGMAVTPRGDGILTPPLPLPTDDFSPLDFQPSFVSSSLIIQAVPEPSTWALVWVGLVFLLPKRKNIQATQFKRLLLGYSVF